MYARTPGLPPSFSAPVSRFFIDMKHPHRNLTAKIWFNSLPFFEAFAEKNVRFYGKLKKQLEKLFSEILVYLSFIS